jgi:hypothetical protein
MSVAVCLDGVLKRLLTFFWGFAHVFTNSAVGVLTHVTWAIHQEMFDDLRLVVGLNPSEQYEFVSWDDYSQYIMEK